MKVKHEIKQGSVFHHYCLIRLNICIARRQFSETRVKVQGVKITILRFNANNIPLAESKLN